MKLTERTKENIILTLAIIAIITGLAMWDRPCSCCVEQLSPEEMGKLFQKFQAQEVK